MLALLPAIHRVVVAPRAADAQAEQRAANVLGAVARVVVTRDKSTRLAAAENVAGQLRQRFVLPNRLEQIAAQLRVTGLLEIFFRAPFGQFEPVAVVAGKNLDERFRAHQPIRRLGQAPGWRQGDEGVEFVRRRRTTGEVDVHPAGEHEGVRLGTGSEAKRLEAGEPGAVERVRRRRLVRRVFVERLADDGSGIAAGVTGDDPRLAGGERGHRAVVVGERDGLVGARENSEPRDVAGDRALAQAVFRHGGETAVARLEPQLGQAARLVLGERRAAPNPAEQRLVIGAAFFENTAALVLDLAGGFAEQQAGFRLGQVDPAAVKVLRERGVVGGGIHREQRQLEAGLAGRRAVALGRGAGLLHQQRRDVVREVKRLRLVRLAGQAGGEQRRGGGANGPRTGHNQSLAALAALPLGWVLGQKSLSQPVGMQRAVAIL